MYEVHPVYLVYVESSYFELDPSMAIVPFFKTDPSEATPMHIRLGSETSSTKENKVEGWWRLGKRHHLLIGLESLV